MPTDFDPLANVTVGALPTIGSDAIEILMNDHVGIKDLLKEIARTSSQASRITLLENLKAVLTVHNATEENLVYPALAVEAEKKAESAKLYHETASADITLYELDSLIKHGEDDKFVQGFETFQKALLEHIDDEESKAFPHLRKYAEASKQQLLTAKVRQFRGAIRVQTAL
jgi:hemerythrin superfamily protein